MRKYVASISIVGGSPDVITASQIELLLGPLGVTKNIVSTFSYLGYTLTIFKKPYFMCEFAPHSFTSCYIEICKYVHEVTKGRNYVFCDPQGLPQ